MLFRFRRSAVGLSRTVEPCLCHVFPSALDARFKGLSCPDLGLNVDEELIRRAGRAHHRLMAGPKPFLGILTITPLAVRSARGFFLRSFSAESRSGLSELTPKPPFSPWLLWIAPERRTQSLGN
ncbi:hypothetical protein Sinac_1248 [Singulisphaera acidiphila DSM 18658]|uniref:Uncharacterized protein n=1 Tax=Singulisphaera acidiphila (strain ATCC BAA-1392 / DSM 18658 / VKM B-2454 / MOB10) TaxID=886293 RepID=L0D8S3_SINAD|nr:hypothetical protein Sinac_1248 [Singulisphaera acidiphila DSM 18658]